MNARFDRIRSTLRRPDMQALLGLAALAFLFLLPAATMQGVYFYGDANDYFARLAYSAERLRGGQLALWNPYLSLGGAHLADPAALATYLPALALFLIFPEPFAYNYTVILHVYLAASGMYLLARAWNFSRGAALLAAIVFGFGGFFVAHLQHLNIVVGAAWLPWIFWCLEKYFSTRRILFLGCGSAVLALQMMGGHTQMALYGGAAWGAYCAVYWARALRARDGRAALRQMRGVALMLAGALGLAAIFVAPFVELLNFTARSERITYEFATSFSLEPLRLLQMVYPFAFGGNPGSAERGAGSLIEMTAYLGVATLAFAVVALWRREWRVYFLASMALGALLLALGKFTPLYVIVFQLPIFGAVRAPARFLELFAFAVALLAGLGLDALRESARREQWFAAFGFLGVTLLGLGALWLAPRAGLPLSETFARAAANPALLAAILFTLAAAGILTLWQRKIFSPRARVALTLTLIFLDVLFFGWNFRYNFVAPLNVYTPGKNAQTLRQSSEALTYYWGLGETKLASYSQNGDMEKYADASRAGLRQSLPLRWRVRSLQGYGTEPPIYQAFMQALEARRVLDAQALKLASLFGVTHVLSAQTLANDALERTQQNASVILYRNTATPQFGRAYIAWKAEEAQNAAAALASLTREDADFARVRLEGAVNASGVADEPQGSVQIERAEPERIAARVETNRAGWLVLNDSYYPGWRATVDNQPARILRANALARAIAVPAGTHQVEFVYDPLSVKIGLIISGVTGLLVCAIIFWDARAARV
ncbi:MAG: hypothetical protein BroJett039_08520 [Chloroflexota bacterium]|nr:MAG: hypothetical protein BroJett039_08520 [Chloroflexota bacterium]